MTDFIDRLKENRELIDRVSEIARSRDTDTLRKFLQEQGVSEEDINWGLKFNKTLHTTTEEKELSDEDLEMVAGGKGCIVHSIDDEGVGLCLLMHNIAGSGADDGSLSACVLADLWVERKTDRI
jgi:hypothetical protein